MEVLALETLTAFAFLPDQDPNLALVGLTDLDAEVGHSVDQLAFHDGTAHWQSSLAPSESFLVVHLFLDSAGVPCGHQVLG